MRCRILNFASLSTIFILNSWNRFVRNRVESLLKCRCKLLNEAFQLTVENLDRLRQVNSHLTNLTKRAYDRIGEI